MEVNGNNLQPTQIMPTCGRDQLAIAGTVFDVEEQTTTDKTRGRDEGASLPNTSIGDEMGDSGHGSFQEKQSASGSFSEDTIVFVDPMAILAELDTSAERPRHIMLCEVTTLKQSRGFLV